MSGNGSTNIVQPTWPAGSPGYQYEYVPGPFSNTQTLVPVPAISNPTQCVPPLAPVANTDTGAAP